MRNEPAIAKPAEPASRHILVDGLRLHYLDWGGDPTRHTIVLLHGGSAHAHWWDMVAPQLTARARVLALDFRGHGQSQWADPRGYGPAAYVHDIRGMAEQLGTRIVVVGHSMGGSVAQWLTVQHPELVEALVVVDSGGGPPPLWIRLQWRWRRRARDRVRPELASAEEVVRRFRLRPPATLLDADQLARLALAGAEQLPNGRWAFRFDPQTRAWRRRARALGRPRAGRISAPTLILRGAGSAIVSRRTALRLHRKITGSIFRELPHAFHHVPLDDPGGTAAAIGEFLDSL